MNGFFNWPGDKLGEKGNKEEKSGEFPAGRAFFPVHIDGVAQGLECVKTDSHGQDDVQRRPVGLEPDRSEKGLKAFGEKAQILESAEYPQIHGEARRENQLSLALVIRISKPDSAGIVHGARNDDEG